MKRNCYPFDYLLIILGILSIIYFILLALNSKFNTTYFIYPIFTFITWVYGFFELKYKISILSKLPKGINYSIKGLIIIGVSIFLIIETLIIVQSRHKYEQKCDFIIILGARLYGSSPAPLLTYRLDAALEYHQKFPDTKIIVSGGQGSGEDISEAMAMKKYLINHGVDESIIIEEDQSTNTNENILFSKQLIETISDKKDYHVLIITNGFHCYRSMLLANKYNLNADTYAAKEHDDTALHYYLREFFGCLKDIIFS